MKNTSAAHQGTLLNKTEWNMLRHRAASLSFFGLDKETSLPCITAIFPLSRFYGPIRSHSASPSRVNDLTIDSRSLVQLSKASYSLSFSTLTEISDSAISISTSCYVVFTLQPSSLTVFFPPATQSRQARYPTSRKHHHTNHMILEFTVCSVLMLRSPLLLDLPRLIWRTRDVLGVVELFAQWLTAARRKDE